MKLAIFLFTIALSNITYANEFLIEGSDLMMGVGAQGIGVAGANTARVNDASAMYWNPANLTQLEQADMQVSGQLNNAVEHINFLTYAQPVDWFSSFGLQAAFGAAYIKRLHVKASGHFAEGQLETLFLAFTLPDIGEEIVGNIETKTRDFRLGFAVGKENWSLGSSISYIDCYTFSCGMKNQINDRIVASGGATAFGVNLGASWQISPEFRIAAQIKDINTKLDVIIKVEEPREYEERIQADIPTDIFLGSFWQISPDQSISMDFQWLFGQYATYQMDVKMLRAGYEYKQKQLIWRGGLIVPINMHFDQMGDLMADLPAPFAPTLGLSYHRSKWQFDAALYPHPLLSYSRNEIVAIVEAGMSYHF